MPARWRPLARLASLRSTLAGTPRGRAAVRAALQVVRIVILILALRNAAFIFFDTVPNRIQHPLLMNDAHVYYDASLRVVNHQPLYEPWPDFGPYWFTGNYMNWPDGRLPYPPPFAVALSYFTRYPFDQFAGMWLQFVCLSFWVYAACLSQLALGRVTLEATLDAAWFLFLIPWMPVILQQGNNDPPMWALFGLALCSRRLRGAALALISLVKLHALWPLGLAVYHEGRRVLLPAVVVIVAAVAFTIHVCGFQSWIDWFRYAMPGLPSQGTFRPDNFSIPFAGLRLLRSLGWWHYTFGPLSRGPRVYFDIVGLAAPLITIWLTRRMKPLLQYSLVACAAMAFAPLFWHYYLAYFFAPAAIAIGEWRKQREEASVSQAQVNARPAPARTSSAQ